jgi:hypothetical protein
MGYYSIPLAERAQQLTSILLPWGKCRYNRLPMGIKVATDIFQETMNHVLGDLLFVHIFFDDVLLLTNGSYEDHIAKVQQVLTCLNKHNFLCRVDKCLFAVTAVKYLGYRLTRDGISPQPKKVEAIHRMTTPTNRKQLRRFLGMVNFYQDMWRQRSHILAPLTMLTLNKAIFEWTDEQQKSIRRNKKCHVPKDNAIVPGLLKRIPCLY